MLGEPEFTGMMEQRGCLWVPWRRLEAITAAAHHGRFDDAFRLQIKFQRALLPMALREVMVEDEQLYIKLAAARHLRDFQLANLIVRGEVAATRSEMLAAYSTLEGL